MTGTQRETTAFDAIVLAGGRGARLGGVDKPQMVFEGSSLLARALAAVEAAGSRIVVGDDENADPPSAQAVRVREYPRWSGPAAAVAAGLSALPESGGGVVVLVAADLPLVLRALPLVLACVEGGWDGWIATDGQGRSQPLLAVYRREPLARRCAELGAAGALHGASLSRLLTGLRLRPVIIDSELCRDLDTPADASHFSITLPTDELRAVRLP